MERWDKVGYVWQHITMALHPAHRMCPGVIFTGAGYLDFGRTKDTQKCGGGKHDCAPPSMNVFLDDQSSISTLTSIIYCLCLFLPTASLAPRPQCPMMEIKRLHHANKMRRRRHNDQHMKNLVRAAPDVKGPRRQPLGYPCCIDACTQYVQCALGDDILQPHALVEFLKAVDGDAVDHWHDTRHPQPDEHHGAVGPPFRGAEHLDPRDCNTA